MTDQQITTISFFKFEGWKNQWWAFQQMAIVPSQLASIDGLTFGKVVGSGAANGFSIWPNWGVYGLLINWENENLAQTFFDQHSIFQSYQEHSKNDWTVYMHNTQVHGEWDGGQPFSPTRAFDKEQLVGVITRATIKLKYLPRFWKFVPKVSQSIEDKKGRLFSVGIGELPLIQQATFSIWESSTLMMEYAYKSKYHKEVVQKTRELGWYKEELFARFLPYKSSGNWEGVDMKYFQKLLITGTQ